MTGARKTTRLSRTGLLLVVFFIIGLVVAVRLFYLQILKAKYFDVAGIIPWYINFVLLKNSIGGSSVSIYDKIVIPPMRLVEKLISPPIGKNILLVAKKD